jgi:hypothetical protein
VPLPLLLLPVLLLFGAGVQVLLLLLRADRSAVLLLHDRLCKWRCSSCR